MILTESIFHGEVELVRHYSDSYVKIRQIETNILYNDAIDLVPCPYTYEETNILVDDDELTPEEAIDIITGVTHE